MLKVGFDISQIAHGGGVATYTKNLAEHLQNSKNLEMVFFYSSLRKPYRGNLKNVKKFYLPPALFEMLFNRWRTVSIEKFIGAVDIFHSSDWTQPPTKAKKVTTYHDVIPIKYPVWSHPKIVAVHKRRLALVEQEADCVIAVSENTKLDLLKISKIPKEKIKVIYEGVDKKFRKMSKDKIAEFKAKYKLPEKFILAIGGIGDRRNLARVTEASKGYHLIIAGKTIPYLDDEELPLLYSSAQVLLYPSFYEGFGLPILEAMACGTPVITSNIGSMAEVAGDSALLVTPTETAEIARAVKVVMEDKEKREDLIKRGFERANKFSWEKAALQTAKVYERLVR